MGVCLCFFVGLDETQRALSNSPNGDNDTYCQQLDRLRQAIDQERSALAKRTHTSVMKPQELGWEVLVHSICERHHDKVGI